jgi:CRP-like cAMP-binding protein
VHAVIRGPGAWALQSVSPTGGTAMTTSNDRTGNLLLDALDPVARDRLLGVAEVLELRVRDIVHEGGGAIDRAYFPTSCVLSMVASLNGGEKLVEATTIGREGMTAPHAVLGSRRGGPEDTIVQVEGLALVVPIERIESVIEVPDTPVQRLFFGYLQALFGQAAYSAACNAVHDVIRRCARWLLQVHDRVTSDSFHLTHDVLSIMLGVERSTVSVSAGELQRRGVIEYSRGVIRIADREGLEAASCECYEKIRSEYSRLVPLT